MCKTEGAERLSNLPKDSQPASYRGWALSLAVWLQGLSWSLTLCHSLSDLSALDLGGSHTLGGLGKNGGQAGLCR